MYKTAQTLAAWEGRGQVTVDDIRRSAEFVLLHRRRRQPFEEPGLDQAQLDSLIQQHLAHHPGDRGSGESRQEPSPQSDPGGTDVEDE
jgi:magnesium chelatase subunit D